MELPATHGTTILRAATRKMTSIMNNKIFAARSVASVLKYFWLRHWADKTPLSSAAGVHVVLSGFATTVQRQWLTCKLNFRTIINHANTNVHISNTLCLRRNRRCVVRVICLHRENGWELPVSMWVEEEEEENENDQISVKFTHLVLVQKKIFFCYSSYGTSNLTLPPLIYVTLR